MDLTSSTAWHTHHNLGYRLKTKFRRKLSTLQKKNPSLHPVTIETKALALNWWAKSWNSNLKNYTPKSTELEKGKLHFRCEALADLKINSNYIQAIVLGSKIKPYDVTIAINPLAQTKWTRIQKLYSDNLESFEKILDNQFPKDMSDIFTTKPTGLLPTLKDITFNCSCSDRKRLCKHTAIALYGLGAKIDEDPKMLFTLRSVNILDFISNSIHAKRKEILKRTHNKKTKILSDTDLSSVFGIQIK